MASRKEQKEQARAARLAQEQDAASKAQRTRRFQMFGGVTVIAVIVIVIAIVASSSGGGGPKGAHAGLLTTGTAERQLVSSVDTLLNKIPQSGNTLGSPTAKVTMQYFGDLECPYCQAFTLDVFPSFVQQEVRTGKVKVEYRSMCTATCDGKMTQAASNAVFNRQQIAADAAGKQDKFWNYVELFYHQQKTEGTGYPTDGFLTGIAKQIPGLNVQTWRTDRTDPSLADEVAADLAYSTKANLPGTPSLIMAGPKGSELVNNGDLVTSESQLTTAVKAVS
jgi:protein-disulfide isomerase